MRVEGTTAQKALVVLGHNPGPIDGVVGDRTRTALYAWLNTLGLADWSVGLIGREAIDVTPDSAAAKLEEAALQYTPPSRRTSSGSSVTTSSGSTLSVPTAFWRMGNPWAWAAVLVPLSLLLGGVGFYFLRSPRGRR